MQGDTLTSFFCLVGALSAALKMTIYIGELSRFKLGPEGLLVLNLMYSFMVR